MQRNCSDPKSVFANLDLLQACYDEFGGNPSNSTFARVVRTCIDDYCNNSGPFPLIGGCGQWPTTTTDLDFAVRERRFFLARYTFFDDPASCEGVKGDANSDIAGPGVFTSYMIQMAFILFLWFLIQVSSAAINCGQVSRASWKGRFPTAATKASELFHRHHVVIRHTLVEFHEAQCFFLLASQIAILTALDVGGGDPSVFGAYTLRAALQNATTAYLVSTMGVLPVVIGLWSLQTAHECSVCTMLLSVTTVAISERALYRTRRVEVQEQMATVDYRGWPASCGGHPPPLVYCGGAEEGGAGGGPLDVPSAFLEAVNPICLTIFAATVLLWSRRRFLELGCVQRYPPFSAGHWLVVALTRPPVHPLLGYAVRFLARWCRLLLDCALFTAMVVSIHVFARYANLVDWKQGWSFGQVVAITLWFPVICKYYYWLCLGTEAYSKARIPSPYRIVKATDHKQAANSSARCCQHLGMAP